MNSSEEVLPKSSHCLEKLRAKSAGLKDKCMMAVCVMIDTSYFTSSLF